VPKAQVDREQAETQVASVRAVQSFVAVVQSVAQEATHWPVEAHWATPPPQPYSQFCTHEDRALQPQRPPQLLAQLATHVRLLEQP
jgi:hypothetical protein